MMSHPRLLIVLAAIVLGAVPASVLAQKTTPAKSGGAVEGSVYLDNNGNGVFDPSEPGVSGVTVHLAGTGQDMAQVTGDGGLYHFANVGDGTYTASVTPGSTYATSGLAKYAGLQPAGETLTSVDFALKRSSGGGSAGAVAPLAVLQVTDTPAPTATLDVTATATITATATAIITATATIEIPTEPPVNPTMAPTKVPGHGSDATGVPPTGVATMAEMAIATATAMPVIAQSMPKTGAGDLNAGLMLLIAVVALGLLGGAGLAMERSRATRR